MRTAAHTQRDAGLSVFVSAFCGDMTDQSRWILFGRAFPGPSFDMLAYCNKSYAAGAGALDDINDAPSNYSDGAMDLPMMPPTKPFFTLQSLTHQAAPPPEA